MTHDQHFFRTWTQWLQATARTLDLNAEEDFRTFDIAVMGLMRNQSVANIRKLVRHFGAQRVPRDRRGAERALSIAFLGSR